VRETSFLSPLEDARLMRLVYQAFDLRDGPYLVDACEAIEDFWEDTRPDRRARRAVAPISMNAAELERRLRR
jgi:hypothetical protein